MSRPPCLSILLLTEDASRKSHETLRALVRKMLLLVNPSCQTHLVEVRPQPERADRAMHGNIWKSKNPRDRFKLVDLRQTIATKLLEQDGFVFFHFDGDRPFGERASSENVAKFAEFVRTYVEPIVKDPFRMARLRPLVPFYSIEAWLYQNTHEGARLCAARRCGRHLQQFDKWQRDRSLLDEVMQPKERICFGSAHNDVLAAAGFPADAVFAADKSFAAAVTDLLRSEDLCEALARTHAPGQGP